MNISNLPCPPQNGICSDAILCDSDYAEFSQHKKIVAEENNRKYVALNGNGECIAKIKVDNGIMPSENEPKADYMIIRCQHNVVYIIELKGSNIKRACEQILSTIDKLSVLLNKANIHARIVCSRAPTPVLRPSQYYKLDRYCKSRKGRLIVKESVLEEVFSTN
ncbi:hypothetical protein LJC15_06115 [Desulfovibrio sp. OttesenSCG-928-G11]|nr:hypothetical protein [Desulfovibrio sp. OttesenSCG-928-G11]